MFALSGRGWGVGLGVHLALLYPPTSSAPQTLIKCKFNNASLIPLCPAGALELLGIPRQHSCGGLFQLITNNLSLSTCNIVVAAIPNAFYVSNNLLFQTSRSFRTFLNSMIQNKGVYHNTLTMYYDNSTVPLCLLQMCLFFGLSSDPQFRSIMD